MSVSAVSSCSSSSTVSPLQNIMQQGRSDFSALATALGSGDLAGAQKAFASLQQDLQGMQPAGASNAAGSTAASTSPFASDYAALGKALQSNDLAGAQKAFSSLMQSMQGARRGHHHHHRAAPTGTDATAANTSTANTSTSSTSSANASTVVTATNQGSASSNDGDADDAGTGANASRINFVA